MKRIVSVFLMLFMIFSCVTGCSGKADGGTDKTASGGNSEKNKVLNVSDFGAKGDGKTDDAKAILDAINAAHKYEEGVTVKFKENAQYLIKKSDYSKVAMDLTGLKNAAIEGKNTTIIISDLTQYIQADYCQNLKIKGLNFKFDKSIYTMSDVINVDMSSKTMTIKADDDLGITENWVSPMVEQNNTFAMIDNQEERQHVFFSDIEIVDKANHIYKLKLTLRNGATEIGYIANMQSKKLRLITPIPDVAHVQGSAFTIYNSKNVTMEDCNIWSSAYFVFSLRYNEEKISFINTNLVPENDSVGKMMSWRDQFHCKDNRAQLIWKNCTISSAFDDVFNISCTVNKVTEVISPTEIKITCKELGGTYPPELKAGDKVTIYNADNGLFCGNTEIVSVSGNNDTLVLKDQLPNLTVGVTVAVDSLAAPDSLIENCVIDGTIRLQTKVTFKDTKLNLYDMWVANAGWTDAEGTIPYDVLFKNCEFKGHGNNKYIGVGTETATYVEPKYYAKNVVFEDCDLSLDNLSVKNGNDVKVIKNGSVVYSSLK